MTEKQQDLFHFDKFEPIKGYPELRWAGKRPFTGTSYYPAQLKESYGSPSESGWMNRLYWGDNLQVMSHLLKEFRGKVDLIYIDPPFDSKADYKKTISLRGKKAESDTSTFEEKQYGDIWTNDEYLQFMYERLVLCRELLSDTGSIYLHCDWHRNSYLRLMMDEVFGISNFVNEVIWKRKGGSSNPSSQYDCATDTILYYSKSKNYAFNSIMIKDSEDVQRYINERFNNYDNNGKQFMKSPIVSPNYRENLRYIYKGYNPPKNGWSISIDVMKTWDAEGKLYFPENGDRIYRKIYLDDYQGQPASNLWTDIYVINPVAKERLDYPTQKPEALLERIIKASSNPGDLVFDCFMGSGTTQAVAMKLGRRFLGADINMGAIQTTTKRLIHCADELKTNLPTDSQTYYTGFEVYNVNHYEFFRNELEAKRLIIEALEMQALPNNTLWDAELDGRKVAILGINRIATASDFERIVSQIDMNDWTKRQMANLNSPVEKITFVCMGHDPNLKAMFENRMSDLGFKVDLEIFDILRSDKKLEFKREADAAISIKDGKLSIDAFYPMNLLQKLSLDNEDVEDWKELVDSVLIDWHYDDVTFSPEVTDVPDPKSMVAGTYVMPKDASRIHIKITDLISESWEGIFDAKGGKI